MRINSLMSSASTRVRFGEQPPNGQKKEPLKADFSAKFDLLASKKGTTNSRNTQQNPPRR